MKSTPLAGLEVVVTGGAGALGRAVVGALAREGALCRVPLRTEAQVASVQALSTNPIEVPSGVDVTNEALVEELFAAYGPERPLWASIHLVGGFHSGTLASSSVSVFDEMMARNARSCYLACRAAAAAMKRGGGAGRIVNVTARPGLTPVAGASMVAYTGAKAAVAAMTLAMAEELAPDRIWVNAVAPSIMNTPRNRADMPDADHGNWPTPEEVAETITFLVSPSNGATRGALVPVYGRA